MGKKLTKEIVKQIPVLERNISFEQLGIQTIADLLTFTEGSSITK